MPGEKSIIEVQRLWRQDKELVRARLSRYRTQQALGYSFLQADQRNIAQATHYLPQTPETLTTFHKQVIERENVAPCMTAEERQTLENLIAAKLKRYKRKSEKTEFQQAKHRLYLTLLHKVEYEFYHGTNAVIIDDELLSPAARKIPGERNNTTQGEQDYIFGWLLPKDCQYPDVIPDTPKQQVYKFDLDKLIAAGLEVTVKGQDPIFFEKTNKSKISICWDGKIYGKVHRQQKIKLSKATKSAVKTVTLIRDDGEKRQHTVTASEQIFRNNHIRMGVALDVIKMIDQIAELDFESALATLKPFTSAYIEQNDPVTVATQQLETAIKLYCQSDLREITVTWKLPFATTSGDNLLSAIERNGETQNKVDFFAQIMANNFATIKKILTDSSQQSTTAFILNTRLDEITPLLMATQLNDFKTMQLLLDKGAKIEDRIYTVTGFNYHFGMTALMIAARTGNLAAVKLLIQHSANMAAINEPSIELATLQSLASMGSIQVINTILNETDFLNTLPSYKDAELIKIHLILLLQIAGHNTAATELKKTLDPTIKLSRQDRFNRMPENALGYAIANYNWDIAAFLIQSGSRFANGMPVPREFFITTTRLGEISRLTRLICETNNPEFCYVTYDFYNKCLTFNFEICNNSAQAGIHHAQVPIIPYVLGSRLYFEGKDSHQFYELETEEKLSTFSIELGSPTKQNGTPHDHDKFDSLTEVRDRLLMREIETLLVCVQNYEHITQYGYPHPATGKGATDSTNLLKSNRLTNYKILTVVATDNTINLKVSNNYAEKVANLFKTVLLLNDNEITIDNPNASITFHMSVMDFIEKLQAKRINYLGILVTDKEGRIALAERKNAWKQHSMGYATAGGHCSQPYYPELAAIETLEEEFGLQAKDSCNPTQHIEIIDTEHQLAILMISLEHLQLTKEAEKYCKAKNLPFMAEADEFVPGTESFFSFKDMKDEQLPLRATFGLALEKYLNHMSEKIQPYINAIPALNGLEIRFDVYHKKFYKNNIVTLNEFFGGIPSSDENDPQSLIYRLLELIKMLHLPKTLGLKKEFKKLTLFIMIEPLLLLQGLLSVQNVDLTFELEIDKRNQPNHEEMKFKTENCINNDSNSDSDDETDKTESLLLEKTYSSFFNSPTTLQITESSKAPSPIKETCLLI